jgi:hypothetical protein
MKKKVIASIVFIVLAGLMAWKLAANKHEINSKKKRRLKLKILL